MDNFFILATQEVLTLNVVLLIAIGTVAGIIAGAIPGFTVTMGIVLAFPFTFAMEPVSGLALMVSVLVGGYSGGIISGIMLGIPGTPSSIATVFDGYPMAKRGEAGRALGIGIFSSFLGNLLGVLLLVTLAPLIAAFSLNFGPWELTVLVIFALTLVGSLSQGAMLKGCIIAGVGLLVASSGIAPSGQPRFSFGIEQLNNGVEMLPVLIGAFAFSQLMKGVEDAQADKLSGSDTAIKTGVKIPFRQILRDVGGQKINFIRSSFIGVFVGAIPAVGGSTANFVSYDQAKKFAKKGEEYGTGTPGGIVATESSNSALLGGALIPTLTLGIPGSLTMAVMYGVLILYGLQPGPTLFVEQPILMGSIYVSMLVSGFVMIVAMLLLIRYFAQISRIPISVLVPLVLMLAAVGSFAVNNSMIDVWTLLFFGVVGYLLEKASVPLAPLILGVVLGPTLETNFFRALELDSNWATFVTRPISGAILVLTLVSVAFIIRQNMVASKKNKDLALRV